MEKLLKLKHCSLTFRLFTDKEDACNYCNNWIIQMKWGDR